MDAQQDHPEGSGKPSDYHRAEGAAAEDEAVMDQL